MADFTADIPPRPADAPGDSYPSDTDDWGPYHRRAARTKYPGWNGTCGIFERTSETSEVVLAEGGTAPGPWTAVSRSETVIAGVKVDYTTFEREYASVRLRKYRRVTVRFLIHYHFLPPTSRYDQRWEETWYTPIGEPWKVGPVIETRSKLTSWGAGITVGGGVTVGAGIELEIGGELEFSHAGEDLTPPSEHPTPRTGGLRRKEAPRDESLGDARRPSSVDSLPVARVLLARDRDPLTEAELELVKRVDVRSLADLGIADIATAVAEGRYPGLVRFLLARVQPASKLPPAALPPGVVPVPAREPPAADDGLDQVPVIDLLEQA